MKGILLLTISLVLISNSLIACIFDGNQTSAGTIIPTAAYQTQAGVSSGNYYTVNVSCGNTYTFSFCNNGGNSAWDTQLTILATDGTTTLAYNDDATCGLPSEITWYSNFTGTIFVLTSQYNCDNTGGQTGATLAYNVTANAIDPTFNLSPSCGGAVSTVTGTPGGTFTFNPAPGDGAQVNSITGTVSNGSAGTTYFVEYTVCSSSSIESVDVIDENCFTLNGTSQYINVGGEDCIQLTDEVNNQTGCAWSGSQIDFNSNFSLSLDYYFGNNINGADGNTFTFQPSSSTACGQNGGQLGAGGIANALSIEFDTYDNDNPAHIYDIACDHIAIETDGDMQNAAPYCGPVCAKAGGGNVDDGGLYEVEIAWDAATQQLQVFFDGALRLTCNGDFVNTVFGGQNMVYWGATSATGGLNNQQYFCPSSVIVLPSELSSFTSKCDDFNEIFEWTSITENRVDYYQLEYTYDGLIFFNEATKEAIGNSTQPINYSLSIEQNDPKQRYYRLKIIDENGDINYTDLIAGNNCNTATQIIKTTIQKDGFLVVKNYEMAQIQLTNQIGQAITNTNEYNTSFKVDTKQFASGFYYLRATTKEGMQQIRKIYLVN